MPEKIIEKPINQIISESFLDYAREVIENRALPDVRDGLKPVQRRILFAMQELGLLYDKPHRKCARIVGDVLGKYHPHGDMSVYNALVNLAQPFSKRYPLIDGQGNFGTIDDGPAAMRYTEARMSSFAMEILKDIEKDTVKWQNNFDDTTQEPTILPGILPNLLVNGSSGIAVGITTNIPPHNLTDVVNAIIAYIDNPKISSEDLVKIICGPDFPSGGIISSQGILECYEKGSGTITVYGRVTTEKSSNNKRRLVITEIPYQVSKSSLINKISRLLKDKSDILDVRDESDQCGIRIVIEINSSCDAKGLLDELFKKTELQVNFNCNMVALVEGKPLTLSLKQIIEEFIKHKKQVIVSKTEFDLKSAEEKGHILDGLIKARNIIDEIILLIKKSSSPKIAKEELVSTYNFSQIQAQAILELRLQKLTTLEGTALEQEYSAILKFIKEKKNILASEKTVLKQLRKELNEIKLKYADERKTSIISC